MTIERPGSRATAGCASAWPQALAWLCRSITERLDAAAAAAGAAGLDDEPPPHRTCGCAQLRQRALRSKAEGRRRCGDAKRRRRPPVSGPQALATPRRRASVVRARPPKLGARRAGRARGRRRHRRRRRLLTRRARRVCRAGSEGVHVFAMLRAELPPIYLRRRPHPAGRRGRAPSCRRGGRTPPAARAHMSIGPFALASLLVADAAGDVVDADADGMEAYIDAACAPR